MRQDYFKNIPSADQEQRFADSLIFRVLNSWFILIKGGNLKLLLKITKIRSLIVTEREELNPDKDYFSTPRQHHAVLVILCTASKHYFFNDGNIHINAEKNEHIDNYILHSFGLLLELSDLFKGGCV